MNSHATISILRLLQDMAIEKGLETSLTTQATDPETFISCPRLNVSIFDFEPHRIGSPSQHENYINLLVHPENEKFMFIIMTHWNKEKEPHIKPLDGFFDSFEYGYRDDFWEKHNPDLCIRMFSVDEVLKAFSDCLKRAEGIGYGLNDNGQIIDLKMDY